MTTQQSPISEENFGISSPLSKWLVYTAAGDNANIAQWLSGRQFDLWVTYYGNQSDQYRDVADYYAARKGGKFQNLRHDYHQYPDIFAAYQYILVMDNDIIIDAEHINHLFTTCMQYDLWIAQPAFRVHSAISHRKNVRAPFSFMRYTNFIEVTCPLFRSDQLITFLKHHYDGSLIGWGIDWWYCEVLSPPPHKMAIIDHYPCTNPKRTEREIDQLQSSREREQHWLEIKAKYRLHLEDEGMQIYHTRYTLQSIWQGFPLAVRQALYVR